VRLDGLDSKKFMAFGIGHLINDVTAACWFNFLFYFLKTVVRTSAASYALLVGQVCDGVFTPVVGYLSDKFVTRWGNNIL
jgi:Na+/melibiose symporter-like transporter